nr:protein kinase-like domain-containing protein [Tanacetum cinerariifolium]
MDKVFDGHGFLKMVASDGSSGEVIRISYGGNVTDHLALLSFKSKITQDPYQVLTSWNHSFHFCDWSGISCGKRHKRVIALRLGSKGLEGSLSTHVGNLSFLRELYLRNNSFQGTIPHELGRLSRLRILYLNRNKFRGVIPTNLSGCSNLEDLWLDRNELAGSIPKEMSLLLKLASLEISKNKLTGGIPPFLGNITSMEVFSARGNPLGGSILDTLGHWKSLKEFYYGDCNLYGSIPHSIFNLSLLVNFSLSTNHLTGSLPSEIGLLEMVDNNFSGKLTIDFSKLRDIEIIRLGRNRFTGKILTTIGKLQKLPILALDRNQFLGPIPDAIGNLSRLTQVYLYSNKLEGHISFGNCKELNGLNLADNRLSELSYNNLSGSIPSDIKDLKMLNHLALSYNKLSHTITSSLGECISLITLKLRGNQFQGIIPSSLSSLGGLEILDISQNNLSGKIPQFLDNLKSLEYLNLSFNDFEGEVPVVGVFANASAFSVLGNHRLCGGLVTLELPKCKERGGLKIRFPFILVIVIAPMLLMATHGFSVANLIGEGRFNSVYKGILDFDDDKSVAMKVLHLQNRGAHKSFQAECKAWRNIRHRNLLKIITSCSSVDFQGNDFKALVYEFMPNGSLHNWLHSNANASKLNLLQRVNILRDVATVLDYLHNCCQTTIVHGDMKPSNILLDADMVAHVGDYGLARLLGTDLNQNSSTGIKGRIGYAPPEYGLGSEMTGSGDVYSFGILLLVVMIGKRPTDDMFNEGLSLHKFAYMALPDHVIDVIDDDAIELQSTEANAKKVEECLVATIKIGVSCSVDSPPERMKIEIVVNELQRILHVLQNI